VNALTLFDDKRLAEVSSAWLIEHHELTRHAEK
jgi:hypothetical protein